MCNVFFKITYLKKTLLINNYAGDRDTGITDLVLISALDQQNLRDLTKKTEKHIDRKLRTLTLTADEFKKLAPSLDKRPQFVLWQGEKNSYIKLDYPLQS